MKAPLIIVSLACAVSLVEPGLAADGDLPPLELGDEIQARDAGVGCRVARIDRRVVIDCRRAGSLRGSYGTVISERDVRVVKFRSNRLAKIVFSARHEGSARRCR